MTCVLYPGDRERIAYDLKIARGKLEAISAVLSRYHRYRLDAVSACADIDHILAHMPKREEPATTADTD